MDGRLTKRVRAPKIAKISLGCHGHSPNRSGLPIILVVTLALLLPTTSGCDQSSESISSSAPSSSPTPQVDRHRSLDHGRPAGITAPSPTERPKIVAFGDSLTAGLGVAPEESYPAQLQRQLDLAGYPYRVINAGVSGETTAGALRRVEWVLKSNPGLVILEAGGNDGLRGIDLKDTRQNLDAIIRRLKAAGVTVVLAGMKLPPNYGAEYTAEFARMFPELARTHQLAFMPFFLEGVATHASLNQADGIHPTGEGYRIIVGHLMPILKPLLNQAPKEAS